MIKIFNSYDTDFRSNGEKVIKIANAKVHKEDNGKYYLQIETSIEYVDYLVSENIIVVETPTGEQAFRISNVEKTKTKIKCRANHIFYDSMNYLILDNYIDDKNCNYALDWLNIHTDHQSPFTTFSDVSGNNSFRCVRKSLYEGIQTILERWGGHLVRDNFNISIKESIGTDNGVTIRYRKNLKSINCSENWDNVVTKLLPVGKDGIMLEYKDNPYNINSVYLYQNYITIPTVINGSVKPITKTVTFEQDINEEDYESIEDYERALRNDLFIQGKNYLNKNRIPQMSYKIDANIERVTDVGDTVVVIDERLGINITTNITSFEYDVVSKQYTSIILGNYRDTIESFNSQIEKTTNDLITKSNENLQVKFNKELKDATDKIFGQIGDSYVIYDGSKIMVVDKLPKEDATNVMVINSNGIGFSNTGINGTVNSAWLIDGTLDMQNINVLNLTADMIKGGTLKLGSNLDEYGTLELYDEENSLVGLIDKNGIRVNGKNGDYVLINSENGFVGYDKNNNKIYWVDDDEFHMKKSVIEEEITMASKIRFLAVSNSSNVGIGIVPLVLGGDS